MGQSQSLVSLCVFVCRFPFLFAFLQDRETRFPLLFHRMRTESCSFRTFIMFLLCCSLFPPTNCPLLLVLPHLPAEEWFPDVIVSTHPSSSLTLHVLSGSAELPADLTEGRYRSTSKIHGEDLMSESCSSSGLTAGFNLI